MSQTPRAAAARVTKKLWPQDAGARRWAAEYGDRLLCVRYRVDPQSQRRQTTVELVVEDVPTLASVRVGVRVAFAETQLRQRVKEAGGKWDAAAALWMLPLGKARQLGLVDRVVAAPG